MRDQTRMLVLAALFAVVTAVANFIKIPVGVVPITLLFFATALSGVLLGPKWGAVSQTVYVVLGLVGLPIFTGGGGLGAIAINNGYYRNEPFLMWVSVVLLVVLVQIIQEAGMRLSRLGDKRIR